MGRRDREAAPFDRLRHDEIGAFFFEARGGFVPRA